MLGLSIGVFDYAIEDAVRSLWSAFMKLFGTQDSLG